jgi:hypothetical protein
MRPNEAGPAAPVSASEARKVDLLGGTINLQMPLDCALDLIAEQEGAEPNGEAAS